MFNKGDKVRVKAFPNQILERRVVAVESNQTVLLCNEEEYNKALRENRTPTAIGFPLQDVIGLKDEKRAT